jgi:hypothetical protein
MTEKPAAKRPTREIRIKRVSADMIREINNAADYYGIDRGSFLKPLIRQKLDELPVHVREFKKLP